MSLDAATLSGSEDKGQMLRAQERMGGILPLETSKIYKSLEGFYAKGVRYSVLFDCL